MLAVALEHCVGERANSRTVVVMTVAVPKAAGLPRVNKLKKRWPSA